MAKKALGRGLGAIFGEASVEAARTERREAGTSGGDERGGEAAAAGDVSRETSKIRVSLIEPNRRQPRTYFDQAALEELAESIRKYGVLQPLIVKKNGSMYELIAGERRWRAARMAGLSEVPVIVKDADPRGSAEIALVENLQREDLNPVEEARAYRALIDEFGLTQEQAAERVSKNRTTVTNSLRLLQLDRRVLSLLEEGVLSAGHARCLAGIENGDDQLALAQHIIAEGLSVRSTEALVRGNWKPKKKKKEVSAPKSNIYIEDCEKRLREALGTKVSIRNGRKDRGKIEIEYYSKEELEGLLTRLL